jgi:hypothetical protein
MTIRTFQVGDDAAQVSIYNEAASRLPRYKRATLDEVRRRCSEPNFDPTTRFFATDNGLAVGYAGFQANGRVSFPWCREGHECQAEDLFHAVLGEMRRRGLKNAFSAYRSDWPAQAHFFLAHGFRKVREMVNFVLDLPDMPTPSVRPHDTIEALGKGDVAGVFGLGEGVIRAESAAALEEHLFCSPLPMSSKSFVIHSRVDGEPQAAGVLVLDRTFTDPTQVDAGMPCFWLGAFGTEGLQTRRINGLFSFVARPGRDLNPLGLELLAHAAKQLYRTDLGTLAAQVPSDAPQLLRFYQHIFRKQGSFPVFALELL